MVSGLMFYGRCTQLYLHIKEDETVKRQKHNGARQTQLCRGQVTWAFAGAVTYMVDSARQWLAAPPPSLLPPVQVDPCAGLGGREGVR